MWGFGQTRRDAPPCTLFCDRAQRPFTDGGHLTAAPSPGAPDGGTLRVLRLLAGKWTIPVVRALAPGGKRPSELVEHLEGISQKVLIQTLRRLEGSGLVTRQVHATVVRRVDYRLTPLGTALLRLLDLLDQWAREHGAPAGVRKNEKPDVGVG